MFPFWCDELLEGFLHAMPLAAAMLTAILASLRPSC